MTNENERRKTKTKIKKKKNNVRIFEQVKVNYSNKFFFFFYLYALLFTLIKFVYVTSNQSERTKKRIALQRTTGIQHQRQQLKTDRHTDRQTKAQKIKK